MEFYLNNKNELEADLKHQLSIDIDENVIKQLEDELFYINMCKVFGPEIEEDKVDIDGETIFFEKSFMLKNFNILFYDGNEIHAVAERGDYYLIFFNTF